MKHVIIGGVGFVGINLVTVLADRGEVVVVTRPSSTKKRPRITRELGRLGAELVILERITSDALARVGGDSYYHVAGVVTGGHRAMWEAHVGLLNAVIDAAKSVGSRVVYTSSTGAMGEVVGAPRGATIEEEDSHLEPSKFIHRTPYEVTKAEGERLLVKRGEELKGRWSIVRPTLIFGPWGYEVQWPLVYRLAKLGLAPYFGSRNMVYSLDVARVLAMAGSGGLDSRWVIVNWPEDRDLGDVAMAICAEAGRRCRKVRLGWSLRLASLTPRADLRMMWHMLKLNYKYRSRVLEGFRYTPFEDAVRSFLEWARTGMNP